MKTTASTKTSNTNSHNGENWPYHPYEGSKPELQGSYVPCANNPCSEHGGSEVYATSAEDALSKAHSNDSFGFTSMKTNKTTNTVAVESVPVNKTITSASNESIGKKAKSRKKPIKSDGYKTIDAEKMAKEQGVYIDDSPLLHRLTDSEIKKYVKTNYPTNTETIDIKKLASDIFKGIHQVDFSHGDSIINKSASILEKSKMDEKNAIAKYSCEWFRPVNGILRDKDFFTNSNYTDDESQKPILLKETNKIIKNINNIMHRKETSKIIDKDIIVFRQRYMKDTLNNRSGEETAYYNAVSKSLTNGLSTIITRPDYMSTTFDIPTDFEANNTSYIIKIPKGTRCLDISSCSDYEREHELLIDKGYQFKVVGIYEFSKLNIDDKKNDLKWDGNKPVIALELIPDADQSNDNY